MSAMSYEEAPTLIPPPIVRAELARNVREGRRLRSLLRLAIQAEEDRQFLDTIRERPVAPAARGLTR